MRNIMSIILVFMLCIVAVGVTLAGLNEAEPTMLSDLLPPKVIIDAGHGGMDGGAVGIDGIIEKDINLKIALKLKDLLTLGGFDVVMTREKDIALFDDGIEGIKNQKTSDMYNRMKSIENNPDAIFLSIHQNKFPQSKYSGAQMFYSTNSPYSEQIAQVLQKQWRVMLQPENKREIKPATNELFLLYNSKIPAVMVECGFLSNLDEAYRLTDDEYQNKMAYIIYTSLLEFMDNIND